MTTIDNGHTSGFADTSVLKSPRWELAPVKTVVDAIAPLPDGAITTMGCFASSEGFSKTVSLVGELARRGHTVTPHLPARSVQNRDHLNGLLDAYREAGVNDIFVVAGNVTKPAGPYHGALDILPEIVSAGFTAGVAAHPEAHPFLEESQAFSLLAEKQSYASYIVTQTCFDAKVLQHWLERLRDFGVALPVHIGMAGVVNRTQLLRLAKWMGIGKSMRFISTQKTLTARLATPGAYNPSTMLAEVLTFASDTKLNVAGLHINTFNQVDATRQWLNKAQVELGT